MSVNPKRKVQPALELNHAVSNSNAPGKYELKYTDDLSIFDVDPDNRDVDSKERVKKLLCVKNNMRKNGFQPDKAISVKTGEYGRLIVRAGQGRLKCAKELGIGVYYIVNDDFNGCITEFEGTEAKWTVNDYVGVYQRKGIPSYNDLWLWSKRNEIPLVASASLLGGECARSGNMRQPISNGTYKIKDRQYADRVANIVNNCRRINPVPVNISFIDAVSRCCRVPYFIESILIDRIDENPTMFFKCGSSEKAVDMISALYNYRTREKKRHFVSDVREAIEARRVIWKKKDAENE
jgi:hypothetical protein